MKVKMYWGQTIRKQTKNDTYLDCHSIAATSKKEAIAKLQKHYPKRKIDYVRLDTWSEEIII